MFTEISIHTSIYCFIGIQNKNAGILLYWQLTTEITSALCPYKSFIHVPGIHEKNSQLTKQKLHNITIIVIFMWHATILNFLKWYKTSQVCEKWGCNYSVAKYNIKLNRLRKTLIQLNQLMSRSHVKDTYAAVTLFQF